MYYEKTIQEIRREIEIVRVKNEKYLPHLGLGPNEIDLPTGRATLSYLLWMCDEIESMDVSSIDDALKAARWMGWILANIEINHFWNNTRSRDLVREDKKLGFDKPHHI